MKVKIFKIGGNVVENDNTLLGFAKDFASLEGNKILIHGGGVMASNMQERLGIRPLMKAGRRITDKETLKIVTMVYAGWCNKHIISTLSSCGCKAIGLSGVDGNIIKASKRNPVEITEHKSDGLTSTETIDFGYVGDIDPKDIDTDMICALSTTGVTPVFCAITHDGNGNLLNTNADSVASSIACAMAGAGYETELIFCFENDGVLYDRNNPESLIPVLDKKSYIQMKTERRIADGMIPKMENAFAALSGGVSKVSVKNASNITRDIGTEIKLD